MLLARNLRWVSCAVVTLMCTSLSRGQCQTWSTEVSNGLVGSVYALQSFDDGTGPVLWVGGDFGFVGTGGQEIARWNGHNWVSTPFLLETVLSLGVYDDGTGPSLYVGGDFDEGIFRWNGFGWADVGSGLGGASGYPSVNALVSFDAGGGAELYAAGGNLHWFGIEGKAIQRWNGHFWNSLGTGLGSTSLGGPYVFAMHAFDDGSGPALYVGGIFETAGGIPVSGVARWNGTQWSAAGSTASEVESFATFDDGSGPALYATGIFHLPGGGSINLARWDGTAWVPPPFQGGGSALAVCNDGNGPALFSLAGIGLVAKWDGHVYSPLGDGVNQNVWAMGVFDEGMGHGPELFVGGQFTQVGGGATSAGIAKWVTCNASIESFCPGDLTLAHCPCMNFGQGGHGCDNSIASGGARLSASGMTSPDTLVLTSSYELPNALSIFLQGNAVTQFVEPFGDGLRCVGGQLLRLYVKNAHGGTAIAPRLGDPSISARSAMLGDPIAPGSLRYYQIYYRDPSPTFCPSPSGGTFNVSNGMRVLW